MTRFVCGTISKCVVAVIAIAAATLSAQAGLAQENTAAKKDTAATLDPNDQKLLDRLVNEFVFDPPADAAFVAEPVMMRTVWGSERLIVRQGWRVAGKKGEPDLVYFCDGDGVSLAKTIKLPKLDFVELCRKRYEVKKKPASTDRPDETFRKMRRNAIGDYDTPALIDAVWLHKLGHDDLAVLALEQAEEQFSNSSDSSDGTQRPVGNLQTRTVDGVKHELATIAFLEMVHAFMVRADDEALRHGQRLLKLYPDQAKQVGQVADLMADLNRRKKNGTLGKPAPPIPTGFDSWDKAKQVAWLIDSLDEVDERQMSQPGGVPLALNPRVSALVALGDAAVPALIDTIDRDNRLTRSVHFWRDFSSQREVLGVREAALTAVMSILKIQAFEARSTGDSFTAHGEAEAKRLAAQLRKYWKEYGGLTPDERMMKTLSNPKSGPKATREAAANLAGLGRKGRQYLNTSGETITFDPDSREPNPAVKKFSNPTAAEAILGAMDRDLAAHEAQRGGQLFQYEQNQIEDAYLTPIMELGDKRIAPELARRCKAADHLSIRRKLALAASKLGDPVPLKDLIRDFQAGQIKISDANDPNTNEHDQPGTVELRGLISCLVESHLPEADVALCELADPKNPYHDQVARQIHEEEPGYGPNPFRQHPFCLAFFRRELDDTRPSGVTYQIKGDEYERAGKNFSSGSPIPDYLRDPSKRRNSANGRVCDDAAADVSEMTLGVPAANPLLLDADQRLNQMKQVLDRFKERFRVATNAENAALEQPPWRDHTLFIPTIGPLDHPATAAEVAKGRAIFELGGRGKLASQKLPAAATFAGPENHSPQKVLIFQAEIGADGKVVYGIVGMGVMRAAAAAELSDIKPLQ